jgi:hypothetical protein
MDDDDDAPEAPEVQNDDDEEDEDVLGSRPAGVGTWYTMLNAVQKELTCVMQSCIVRLPMRLSLFPYEDFSDLSNV